MARIADCLANPGKTIDFNGRKVTYPDIKLVYVAGGNPFHHHQDTNNLVKAWRKPQTVIVHEPYWTATAKHADIVLPATTSYERNDLEMGGDYSQRYVFPMHQCVPPQFEARNDFDIFRDVAAKLGLQEQYTEGKDEMLWLKQMYDGMAAQARGARVALPPFNMFWESNNYIRFPVPEANRQWIRHADFRENPLLNPLGTPSGKIEIFSSTVAGMGYADCAGHPKWYEPKEWIKSKEATRYPLSLNTSHPTQRLHSQLDNTPLRDKFAVADREAILIHPDDAKARGIQDGDLVRAFNDRGQILVGPCSRPTSARGWCGCAKGPGSIRPNRARRGACARTATSTASPSTKHLQPGAGQLRSHGPAADREVPGPAPVNTAHAVPANA